MRYRRTGSAVVLRGSQASLFFLDGEPCVLGCRQRAVHQQTSGTSYSVLPSGPRATLIATWPGEWSDHSTKITTLTGTDQASDLVRVLTRLSEDVWDAAAWLDTHPAIEADISELIDRLRSQEDKIEDIHFAENGYRHTSQWSFTDARGPLATDLPTVISPLSRAQRLTVVGELSADAASQAEALRVLPAGWNHPRPPARGRPARSPGRWGNGQAGPLPEGAAAWLICGWRPGPLAG